MFKRDTSSSQDSFSFSELALILLIFILSVLAVIVNLNPKQRLNVASNARRFSDVTSILDDVQDYLRSGGDLIDDFDLEFEKAYEIGQCRSEAQCSAVAVQDSCVNLNLIGDMPQDPDIGSLEYSAYYLIPHENGEFTVGACEPETEMIMGKERNVKINLRD